ncbi:hypothetical protein V8B55DRAFT_1569751 [Mucor lusitanicus]|uniref:F-box domain-containing protein n=2 Tax=Mucor circinelloides f. lusitanicus TaxID=29924 RepID=A0A168KFK0_MUCCL|nr:hypothetical protein FB192DRAFT_1442096 [Mucor lusitanicus]OAD02338.1 hypothetical protein MUCCIDRAFT_111709 [Mucor lusitanicus CBS 277.49]
MFTDIPEQLMKQLMSKILEDTDSAADLVQYCLVCKSWNGIAKPLLIERSAAKISHMPGLIATILHYSDSVVNLAQLRLVCKSWNAIAEPLMFSRGIQIKSSNAALSLYGHLHRRPSYGKLIRNLHFEEVYVPAAIQRGLLQLVFTPNMERITGEIDDDEFYLLMNNIASKGRDRYDKLKAIPHPAFFSAVYCVALLNFKSTLEEITYSLQDENGEATSPSWDLSSSFDSFVNLVKFELEVDLDAMFDLESTLAGCSQLQELTVKAHLNDKIHAKSEVEAWAPTNVKIVGTVKKLVIHRECRSDLLEYLLFKYPNTDRIEIDVMKPLITSSYNLYRTVKVIKAIRSHKVKFTVKNDDLIDSLRFLIADGVCFQLKEDAETGYFAIEINNIL